MAEKEPLSIMDELPKWQKTAPYVRRFIVITGWVAFISIPILCLYWNRNIDAVFASMYATFSAVLGTVVGFYFYRRGSQDAALTNAVTNEKLQSQQFVQATKMQEQQFDQDEKMMLIEEDCEELNEKKVE